MQDSNPSPTHLRTALFVDFDNIYLGLQREDPVAAEQFATDPTRWLTWLQDQLPHQRRTDGGLPPAQDPLPPLLSQPLAVRPLPPLLHPLGHRGGRLPAADQRRQDQRRHPHGDGHPRHAEPPDAVRRVHPALRRRRLHAGAAAPLQARPAQRHPRHRPRLGGLQGGLRPADRPGHLPRGGDRRHPEPDRPRRRRPQHTRR